LHSLRAAVRPMLAAGRLLAVSPLPPLLLGALRDLRSPLHAT